MGQQEIIDLLISGEYKTYSTILAGATTGERRTQKIIRAMMQSGELARKRENNTTYYRLLNHED